MATRRKPAVTIVGHYFHTWEDREGTRAIKWQGHVLSKVKRDVYLVELFSWLTGGPLERLLVPVEQMIGWTFYADADAMTYRYQSLQAEPRREAQS
jgi:hypothetical protein